MFIVGNNKLNFKPYIVVCATHSERLLILANDNYIVYHLLTPMTMLCTYLQQLL